MANVYLIEACEKKSRTIAVRAETPDMAMYLASGYICGEIDEDSDFFDTTICDVSEETECECLEIIDAISDCDDIDTAVLKFEDETDDSI